MKWVTYENWHTGMIEFGSIPIFIIAIIYAPASMWLYVPLIYFIVMGLGFRAGVHGLFCHGSYDPPKWWRYLLIYLSTITNVGPVPFVVALHRAHHKFADKPEDPDNHSFFYRFNGRMAGKGKIKRELVWVMKDPFMKMAYENHYVMILAHIAILIALAIIFSQPWIVFFGWLCPAALTIWAYDINQATAHRPVFPFNYRNFDTNDTSQNNLIQAILLCGEGMHNNHHRRPGAWAYPVKWWEWFFDWPALFIWMVKK